VPHIPETAPAANRGEEQQLVTCANPGCGNEFERKSGRGRPQLFCTPECRVAHFQQAKTAAGQDRFLQIGEKFNSKAKLTRVAFRVSRLMEFCTERELQNQTGHGVSEWPKVVVKELIDNALDACEEAEVAPEITLAVAPGSMVVQDNGPGLDAETIQGILDYSIRVSSREAYVSPTRGAQGNALKTILAMAFVLDRSLQDEAVGTTIIEARGVEHRIEFRVDHVNNQPKITHTTAPSPIVVGTRVTTQWPMTDSRGFGPPPLEEAIGEILRIAEGYTWFNPHLALRVVWEGNEVLNIRATKPDWRKWGPRDPTSAHWYDAARLQRYLAAHVARGRDLGTDRTVREFITEFRGCAGSAVQSAILEEVGCARQSLAEFFGVDRANRAGIARLLAALQEHTKPVPPKLLGIIGREHFRQRVLESGGNAETFEYHQDNGVTPEGIPFVTEFAFALHQSGLTQGATPAPRRKIVTGANWSVGINNPFRAFGSTGEGLENTLTLVRANAAEPVICALHLASAYIQYADRGKSSIILADNAEQSNG
jgi:hypothetical protein